MNARSLRYAAVLAGAVLVCVGAQARQARAHALAPSLLVLEETAAGCVEMLWRTPLRAATPEALRPLLPPDCTPLGPRVVSREESRETERVLLRCSRDLAGETLRVEGLERTGTNVLVRVVLADGRQLQALLSASEPSWVIPRRAEPLAVAARFVLLGIRHLVSGADHLLFVAGLVCLLRGGRRLFGAITSFTAGHSVTLALATLGIVQVPAAAAEVGIAASLVLLATEIVAPRTGGTPGLLARAPWLMAGGFGLLHGLGFAGALHEVGLPSGDVPLALASFNLGIEVAQLVLVGALLVGAHLLRPLPDSWLRLAPRLAGEGIGVLGIFLCLERLAAMGGP